MRASPLKTKILENANKNPKEVIDGFYGEYRWLSNFHLVDLPYKGLIYPSSEHLYQALKVIGTNPEAAEKVRLASSPNKARLAGREVPLPTNWEEVKLSKMEETLRIKFAKETELGEMLKATGTALLEPKIWWHDCFFEKCICEKCGGKGENNLGKLLMKIRDEK